MNNLFWFLWGFDAVIACVVLYFFVIGIADGSVSSFNIGLWLVLLLVVGAVLVGSLLLKSAGKMGMAKTLLSVLAIPGMLGVLFFLIVLIGKPRWN